MVLAILLAPSIPPSIHADNEQIPVHVFSTEVHDHPKQNIISDEALCNCYKYQKERYFPHLPSSADILSNLNQNNGELVVFYYSDSGLHHYAKVIHRTDTDITIDETNYKTCQRTVRTIPINHHTIVGYWGSNM